MFLLTSSRRAGYEGVFFPAAQGCLSARLTFVPMKARPAFNGVYTAAYVASARELPNPLGSWGGVNPSLKIVGMGSFTLTHDHIGVSVLTYAQTITLHLQKCSMSQCDEAS